VTVDNPLLQDDPLEKPGKEDRPTPEQRAEFVVRRLEQFIRENRSASEGMSFQKWQEMARTEIANSIVDAENEYQDDDVVSNRLVISIAACFVTIGFWGTLLAFDKAHYLLVAIICAVAGIWLFAVAGEWRFRRFFRARKALKRARSLRRVESLSRRIKRMESELEDEAKELEKSIREMVRTKAHKSVAQAKLETQMEELREKIGAS